MSFSQFKIENIPSTENTLHVNTSFRRIKGTLSGISFIDKDTKQYISYVPALDISGYGETREKAEEMIKFSMEQFFVYLLELSPSDLISELRKYGWDKSKFFNKRYSTKVISMNEALKDFNAEENSVKGITLKAA